jgi:hypothetical protein
VVSVLKPVSGCMKKKMMLQRTKTCSGFRKRFRRPERYSKVSSPGRKSSAKKLRASGDSRLAKTLTASPRKCRSE